MAAERRESAEHATDGDDKSDDEIQITLPPQPVVEENGASSLCEAV
jgi:hypothetical protein